jgi:hypothetical protein
MSFLITFNKYSGLLYDYTPACHRELKRDCGFKDYKYKIIRVSTLVLPSVLELAFKSRFQRLWIDCTSGGVMVKPYMDHVKRWLERELTDEHNLEVHIGACWDVNKTQPWDREYSGNITKLDFTLHVLRDATDAVDPVIASFQIDLCNDPISFPVGCDRVIDILVHSHVFDKDCESLMSYLFHLPNRIHFDIWDNRSRTFPVDNEERKTVEKSEG